MEAFIGHASAYQYWRTHDLPPASRSSQARPRPGSPVGSAELAALDVEAFGIAKPVHLVVADEDDRRRSKSIVTHIRSASLPQGSFVELKEGLYVSSPDTSFIEMSSELSLVELARYGYVLCSSYAYDEESERGFRERAPLTTVKALAKAVKEGRGRRGLDKAARALRYVAAVSASPMETILAMALCLPRMVGGYGLDVPELNLRIEAREGGLVRRSYFKCDLFWPKSRVAVEYESDEHHLGRAAETRDSSRRAALMAQGITVVTVTTDQFFDARRFDEAARAVAKLTGKRLPSDGGGWMTKRHRLRQELLSELRGKRGGCPASFSD